uniref:SymE family type I addiction module toxin n=1 Tax=Yersinia aldovae TaxID=29483 RepID=UPI0011A2E790|nr:SymE family type I addiction module toxin [Yersinia aldovae]
MIGGGRSPHIGTDWRQDNGELYLAGEWLTQSGRAGQPLAISVMHGQVVIQVQQNNIFA